MSSSSEPAVTDVNLGSPRRKTVFSTVDEAKVKTGIAGSTSNLVNSIVGSGIIGLPYAMRESGLVAGFALLIVVSYMTDKSLRLIVDLASYHPELHGLSVRTFEDMMSIPYGIRGRHFVMVAMFILAYGAMVSYMIIVKDTVPTVLGLGNSVFDRELVMIILCSCTMLPLSMMRDISQLAFTSGLSITADVILVLVVLIHAPIGTSISDAGGLFSVLSSNVVHEGLFIGLGVLSTAMACQHSAFLISGTLDDPTSERWATVTKMSLAVAGTLSTVFAVTGYLGYLDETQGDVLNNFEPNSKAVNAGRVLLAITMVFTFPMECFVTRHVMSQLLFEGDLDNVTMGPNGEPQHEIKTFGLIGRRERWTFYLYMAALIPAILFRDIGPVLSFTGSLGGSAIAYVAPGMAYLGLHGSEFLQWVGSSQSSAATSTTNDAGEIELPVAGDAEAEMQTNTSSSMEPTSRPWWWFPALMPIWVAIASSGAAGTKLSLEAYQPRHSTEAAADAAQSQHIGARKRDFIWSMVFVAFGVVAGTLGVISNVVLRVRDEFFSP